MNQKTLIFDFDGTICDTGPAALEVINELSADYGYEKISEAQAQDLREMDSKEWIQHLGLSLIQLPFFLNKVRKNLRSRMPSLQPIEGMDEVVRTLHEKGFHLGVLTSNAKENVQSFLQSHKLDLFDFIRVTNGYFGKAKDLRKLLKEYSLQKSDVLFVGDETRDVEACQEANIDILAVTWGFHSANILSALNPTYIIDEPKKMLPEIERRFS